MFNLINQLNKKQVTLIIVSDITSRIRGMLSFDNDEWSVTTNYGLIETFKTSQVRNVQDFFIQIRK